MFKGGYQILDLTELGTFTSSNVVIENASTRKEKVIKTIISLQKQKFVKPVVAVAVKEDNTYLLSVMGIHRTDTDIDFHCTYSGYPFISEISYDSQADILNIVITEV